MPVVVAQALALALLSSAMWAGYRRWVLPKGAALDRQSRVLLLLVIMTLMGGVIGGCFWWLDVPGTFSWDLPPLASRMLAAAGFSFGVVTLLVLEHPAPRRLRLVLVLLAVYLLPLLVAAPLFHRDRFDPGAPITYSFFTIVALMSAATVWFLFRPPAVLTAPDEPVLAGPATRAWLGLCAAITALWGLALFATDKGPSSSVWVWPGDLLTSRLIGVMLLTLAVGALRSLRHADVARLMLAMLLTYGLGLAAASIWNSFSAKPIKPAYVVVFGVLALGSLFVLWRERGTAPAMRGFREALPEVPSGQQRQGRS